MKTRVPMVCSLLVLSLFFGCFSEENVKEEPPFLEITGLKFKGEGFDLIITSSKESPKTRIEAINKQNTLLFSTFFDLKKGSNALELDLPLYEELTIECTPDKGKIVSREFKELASVFEYLEFKEGLMLEYEVNRIGIKPQYLYIYVTGETANDWNCLTVSLVPESIFEGKGNETIVIFHEFNISKENSSMESLGWFSRAEFLGDKNVEYSGFDSFEAGLLWMPFPLSSVKRILGEKTEMRIERLFLEGKLKLEDLDFRDLLGDESMRHEEINFTTQGMRECGGYNCIEVLKTASYSNPEIMLVNPKKPHNVFSSGFSKASTELIGVKWKDFNLSDFNSFPSLEILEEFKQ